MIVLGFFPTLRLSSPLTTPMGILMCSAIALVVSCWDWLAVEFVREWHAELPQWGAFAEGGGEADVDMRAKVARRLCFILCAAATRHQFVSFAEPEGLNPCHFAGLPESGAPGVRLF